MVELMTGAVDNLMIAACSATFFTGSPVPLTAGFLIVGCHYSTESLARRGVVWQALNAYWQFTRPHTVIGTTLSIAVVSTIAVVHSPAEADPKVR